VFKNLYHLLLRTKSVVDCVMNKTRPVRIGWRSWSSSLYSQKVFSFSRRKTIRSVWHQAP